MLLYHSSTITSLALLKPQKTLSNDRYIGDFIFATANKTLALMYLTPKGIATLMNPDGSHPDIVICSTIEEFLKKDKGGAVYKLPDQGFSETPQKSLSNYEMVSRNVVKPINKTIYESTLKALTQAKIEIRFTDKNTFASLIHNPAQDKLIQELPLYS